MALAKALDLDRRPARIECFDISHFQGSETYASCVVFIDGESAPAEYRVFKLDMSQPDDFASLSEAVFRRYRRVSEEGGQMPDLLVIDGGRGQLSAALSSLDRLGIDLPAASLAKREELVFLPGRSAALTLPRRNAGLRLLQRARDEAHRFGLKHHRRSLGKQMTATGLTEIPGIGEKTARRLLEKLGSLESVLAASEEVLREAVGGKAAHSVVSFRTKIASDP
jgi:excinuclease ABC subunit C